jgi:hypothetical protein
MAGLLTCPGFLKPSHGAQTSQWQVFQITIIVKNDQASQQRVLLRIQTAFPFHCSVKKHTATPKHNKDI